MIVLVKVQQSSHANTPYCRNCACTCVRLQRLDPIAVYRSLLGLWSVVSASSWTFCSITVSRSFCKNPPRPNSSPKFTSSHPVQVAALLHSQLSIVTFSFFISHKQCPPDCFSKCPFSVHWWAIWTTILFSGKCQSNFSLSVSSLREIRNVYVEHFFFFIILARLPSKHYFVNFVAQICAGNISRLNLKILYMYHIKELPFE